MFLGQGNAGLCAVMLRCDAVCGGGAEREQWSLLHSPPDFKLSLHYPQSNWAPLVLVPEWVGLCALQAPMGLSNDLSCEAGSLSCCCPNPHWCFQSEVCLGCGSASLPAVCLVYLCANVGPRGATCRSACPVLHHSESGPLGLSV